MDTGDVLLGAVAYALLRGRGRRNSARHKAARDDLGNIETVDLIGAGILFVIFVIFVIIVGWIAFS